MELKLDTSVRDANIFIYGKLGPEATSLILYSKIHLPRNAQMIYRIQKDGGRVWLIRESRMDGLLTVQSASFDQGQGFWKENNYERYMLSRNHGWIQNGKEGMEFDKKIQNAGGIIKMTETNAAPFVTGLLQLLDTQGYLTKNRINPELGEETTIKGYSRYVDNEVSVKKNSFYSRAHGSNPTRVFFQSEKKDGETVISLPEGILMALSCPLATSKTGEIQLMQDPVTLLQDGVTYERRYLEQCSNVTLQEGVDYYPNIKLKSIINYVSATHLTLEDYLAKLAKVEIDILDPVYLIDMTNPILSPSGLSYEKSTLDTWSKRTCLAVEPENSDRPITDPLTLQNIRGKQLVENSNLKLFIKSWPDFYESRKAIQARLSL